MVGHFITAMSVPMMEYTPVSVPAVGSALTAIFYEGQLACYECKAEDTI